MIRNGRIMTRQTGSLFRNTKFMNRKTGPLFRNTWFMIRNTRCMTRIMWIYDSKYEMHDSNYVDLWFEVGAAWIELRWFMIRNGRIMTRQTGSLFRNTRFMNRKTGSLFWNTRYMIRLTGSLTSSGSVYLTTRNDTPPPRRRFVESYFYHLAPGHIVSLTTWSGMQQEISHSAICRKLNPIGYRKN